MSTFKEKTTKYSSFVNNKNRKKQANIQDTVDICHKKMMDSFQKGHSSVDKWNQKIEKYKKEIEKINSLEPSLDNTTKKTFLKKKLKC
jgi:hypothetical protein